jgi:alanine racemase
MGGYYGQAWGEVLRHQLTPVIYDAAQVEALANEVRYSGAEPIAVHLKIDTGMARLGAQPGELAGIGRALAKFPEVVLDGLMTHFACADSGDPTSVEQQLVRFDEASGALERLGFKPKVRHAANSAAVFSCERSHLDFVRPGISLFGVQPTPGSCGDLRPAMKVLTQVVALREIQPGHSVGYGATWTAKRRTQVATIPMGYADGLSRSLSNSGHVLLGGRRAPIIGAVSMDMAMVDVTDVPALALGDEAVVLGSQKGPHGEDTIGADEIARQMGTIPWEVLTNISRRVPRFYREP